MVQQALMEYYIDLQQDVLESTLSCFQHFWPIISDLIGRAITNLQMVQHFINSLIAFPKWLHGCHLHCGLLPLIETKRNSHYIVSKCKAIGHVVEAFQKLEANDLSVVGYVESSQQITSSNWTNKSHIKILICYLFSINFFLFYFSYQYFYNCFEMRMHIYIFNFNGIHWYLKLV